MDDSEQWLTLDLTYTPDIQRALLWTTEALEQLRRRHRGQPLPDDEEEPSENLIAFVYMGWAEEDALFAVGDPCAEQVFLQKTVWRLQEALKPENLRAARHRRVWEYIRSLRPGEVRGPRVKLTDVAHAFERAESAGRSFERWLGGGVNDSVSLKCERDFHWYFPPLSDASRLVFVELMKVGRGMRSGGIRQNRGSARGSL